MKSSPITPSLLTIIFLTLQIHAISAELPSRQYTRHHTSLNLGSGSFPNHKKKRKCKSHSRVYGNVNGLSTLADRVKHPLTRLSSFLPNIAFDLGSSSNASIDDPFTSASDSTIPLLDLPINQVMQTTPPIPSPSLIQPQSQSQKPSQISVFYPIMTSFLYHLSISLTTSTFPKLINKLLLPTLPQASQDLALKYYGVSPEGGVLYSDLLFTDQVFTLLSVAPLLALSDRFGRRPFIIWSTFGILVGWLTILLATFKLSINMLYAGRIIDGLSSIMAPLCAIYMCDITQRSQNLTQRLGTLQGIGIGCAFILGAPIGGILSMGGKPEKAVVAAVAVAAVNFVFTLLFLPESRIKQKDDEKRDSLSKSIINALNPVPSITKIISTPQILKPTLTLAFFYIILNTFQVTIFNIARIKFNWDTSRTAGLQFMSGLFMVLVPRFITPLLGGGRSINAGVALITVAMLGLSYASTATLFQTSGILLGFSAALILPSLTAQLAKMVSSSDRGKLFGVIESLVTFEKALIYPVMGRVLAKGIKKGVPSLPYMYASWVGAGAVGWCFISGGK